jgi:uncharacterized protein (DUF433 family)
MPQEPLIEINPNVLDGTPVFGGTRVPIQKLFDYLEAGEPLKEFLDEYPTVAHWHAVAVLELARQTLLASDHAHPIE